MHINKRQKNNKSTNENKANSTLTTIITSHNHYYISNSQRKAKKGIYEAVFYKCVLWIDFNDKQQRKMIW